VERLYEVSLVPQTSGSIPVNPIIEDGSQTLNSWNWQAWGVNQAGPPANYNWDLVATLSKDLSSPFLEICHGLETPALNYSLVNPFMYGICHVQNTSSKSLLVRCVLTATMGLPTGSVVAAQYALALGVDHAQVPPIASNPIFIPSSVHQFSLAATEMTNITCQCLTVIEPNDFIAPIWTQFNGSNQQVLYWTACTLKDGLYSKC